MIYSYDILINPPKEVPLTVEQFKHLSYFGIASLWCNYRVIFYYNEDRDLEMYFHDYIIFKLCEKNYRFKNIEWYEIPSAEMYTCTIPKDHEVVKTIEKYFTHLILKSQ